jgi:hypothetical protein
MNNYDYQKPQISRYNLSRLVGPGASVLHTTLPHLILFSGVVVVEEDEHKHQVAPSKLTPILILIT